MKSKSLILEILFAILLILLLAFNLPKILASDNTLKQLATFISIGMSLLFIGLRIWQVRKAANS